MAVAEKLLMAAHPLAAPHASSLRQKLLAHRANYWRADHHAAQEGEPRTSAAAQRL